MTFESGDEFDVGALMSEQGRATILGLEEGDEVEIVMSQRQGDNLYGYFQVPSLGIPDGSWLQSDQGTTTNPC